MPQCSIFAAGCSRSRWYTAGNQGWTDPGRLPTRETSRIVFAFAIDDPDAEMKAKFTCHDRPRPFNMCTVHERYHLCSNLKKKIEARHSTPGKAVVLSRHCRVETYVRNRQFRHAAGCAPGTTATAGSLGDHVGPTASCQNLDGMLGYGEGLQPDE